MDTFFFFTNFLAIVALLFGSTVFALVMFGFIFEAWSYENDLGYRIECIRRGRPRFPILRSSILPTIAFVWLLSAWWTGRLW